MMRPRLLATAALAAGLAGCSSLDAPDGVFALQFDRLPSPAVVAGDTLRDSLGIAVSLGARAFDQAGNELIDAPISYLALDTGVTITAEGRLVADSGAAGTSPEIVATVAGLQSRKVAVLVTLPPDTLRTDGAVPTITYSPVPGDPRNTSGDLRVALRSFTPQAAAPSDSAVRGWRVAWRIVRGARAAVADSTRLEPSADAAGIAGLDTTDAQGIASRRVRLVPVLGANDADTIIVEASATYRGLPVPGSPVRFLVPLQRFTPSAP